MDPIEGLEGRCLPAPVVTTFPVPDAGFEGGMVDTPDGALWMINLDDATPVIVLDRIDPSTGRVTSVSLTSPDGSTRPTGQLVTTADGELWFPLASTDNNSGAVTDIGRFDPVSGLLTDYTIPLGTQSNWDPSFDGPFGVRGITVGPDGEVWFDAADSTTSGGADQVTIGRITSAGDVELLGNLTTPVVSLSSITTGADGNFYFTTSELFRASPAGVITQVPTYPASVVFGVSTYSCDLQSGPGGDLWGKKLATTQPTILRVDPRTGVVTEYPIASPNASFVIGGMATGQDGNLWIGELEYDSNTAMLARLDVATGTITQFPLTLPSSRFPQQIGSLITGPDGNLWFNEPLGFRVDRLAMNSVVTASGNDVSATVGEPWTGVVATFSPDGVTPALNDYSALIDYGDGTTAPGTVTPVASGGFGVSGAHTFAATGSFPVSVTILYRGTPVATTACQASVGTPPVVTSVHRLGVGREPTQLVVHYNKPLNGVARDLADYVLTPVGPHGHRGRPVPLASAAYNAAAQTFTLRPSARLALRQTFLLQIGGTAPQPITNRGTRARSRVEQPTPANVTTFLLRGFTARRWNGPVIPRTAGE